MPRRNRATRTPQHRRGRCAECNRPMPAPGRVCQSCQNAPEAAGWDRHDQRDGYAAAAEVS